MDRRIMVICDYSLDYLGGAQTALQEQCRALVASGADVTLVAPTDQSHAVKGVDIVNVRATFTLPVLRLPVVRNTSALRHRLRTILIQRRTQVLHLHSEFGIAAAALEVAAELELPVVHTVHTFFWQTELPVQRLLQIMVPRLHHWLTGLHSPRRGLADRPGDSALRNMTLSVAQRADRVISPSQHQAERLQAAGLTAVEVIPNTLGTIPEAEPLDQIDGPLKILWVGRCVEEKRLLPFVRAVLVAIKQLGQGHLQVLVVGEGEQLGEARRLAAGQNDIEFLGRVDHEAVQELFARTHLSALTSYGFDNQPMTVVESIMALRGVIFCDPALTEGLIGPGIQALGSSEEVLSDTLVSLAANPERVLAASRAAVQARTEFDPATFVRRVQRCYARAGDAATVTDARE